MQSKTGLSPSKCTICDSNGELELTFLSYTQFTTGFLHPENHRRFRASDIFFVIGSMCTAVMRRPLPIVSRGEENNINQAVQGVNWQLEVGHFSKFR